jgi:hypothetical protein
MLSKLAKFVVVALAAIGGATIASAAEQGSAIGLTNRIWVETKPGNGLPGVMTLFLSNGTMMIDSCWETYSIATWRQTAPKTLSWDENGIKINADIVSLSKSELVLRVGAAAARDKTEHRYAPAKAPYVCPDMKR